MAKPSNVVRTCPRPKPPTEREQADIELHVIWCNHAASFTKPGIYDREGLVRAEKVWDAVPRTPTAELHVVWRKYAACFAGPSAQAVFEYAAEAWRANPHRMRSMPGDLSRQQAWRLHHTNDRRHGQELLLMVQAVALAYPEKSPTSIVRMVAKTVVRDVAADPAAVRLTPKRAELDSPEKVAIEARRLVELAKRVKLATPSEVAAADMETESDTVERQIWRWIKTYERQFPRQRYPELVLFPGRERR
jgi:hypothetical protein